MNKTEVPFSRWAVFISGQGTNLQALLDARPAITIPLVVSSRSEAPGVGRAHKAGVPVQVLPKAIDWNSLSEQLKQQNIDGIFLLGFMKILPETFISQWSGRILNLHPSLLPHYRGLHAIERSYQEGAAMGVTIHWVIPELDAGPILMQREVFPAQTSRPMSLEAAQEKIHQVENEMVVEAVRRCQQ